MNNKLTPAERLLGELFKPASSSLTFMPAAEAKESSTLKTVLGAEDSMSTFTSAAVRVQELITAAKIFLKNLLPMQEMLSEAAGKQVSLPEAFRELKGHYNFTFSGLMKQRPGVVRSNSTPEQAALWDDVIDCLQYHYGASDTFTQNQAGDWVTSFGIVFDTTALWDALTFLQEKEGLCADAQAELDELVRQVSVYLPAASERYADDV